MKFYLPVGMALGWSILILSSCTPRGELVSETPCDGAIANVTTTWRVPYYTTRNRLHPNDLRIEEFASTKLVNRDGEKPAGAFEGPNGDGVWFPAPPPKPSNDELEKIRQPGEQYDPPELHQSIKYSLQCVDGELTTNGAVYRQVAAVIQTGTKVRVRYSLGRVLRVFTPSGEIAIDAPANSPEPQPRGGESPEGKSDRPVPEASSTIVYVDPQAGNNEDSGQADHPFKTITHALGRAQANTTIQLRPGVYSEYSGEQFPLVLKPGITLRGEAQTQGQGVQITGGGKFLSPTWGGQSVTIVAVDSSHVVGVKLTNPNTRGTAIWVETGSPLIEQNTFLGSDREGVFVSGTATPRIRNNGFEQNGGNGISCTRDSGGVFQGNIIRNNGFGVSISDRANPSFVSNQIIKNKDGFVINGASEPILRLNIVENNGRDGIVITNNAKPILTQNTLSQNGQYDLQNATGQPLKVEGNLAGVKIEGGIEKSQ